MRIVAVTGGAGRAGRLVVAALHRRGLGVRCLVHARAVEGADESVRGDLLDAGSLAPLVAGAHAVVHMAATTHARRAAGYRRVNVEGTRNLLAAAERARVDRFVHLSSAAISRSGGMYSRSKADAEALVLASPLETVVLRPGVLVGTGAAKDLDGLVADARAGRPLLVVGAGRHEVRPTLAADVAEAIAEAVVARSAAGRVYTLAGEALTLRAFAEAARDAFGGRSRIVRVPEALIRVASPFARILPLPLYPDQLARLRAPRSLPSPEAEADLGFRARPFEEVLAATVEGRDDSSR